MVQIDFQIVSQIDKMISDYTNLVAILKDIGDPAGSSELMNAKLREIRRLKAYRGADLSKIPKILESFVNEAGYESSSAKVELVVTDVTADRLYIEASPVNMIMHILYTLKDDRIISEVAAYGEDKHGTWGGMYLIGLRVFPFRALYSKPI